MLGYKGTEIAPTCSMDISKIDHSDLLVVEINAILSPGLTPILIRAELTWLTVSKKICVEIDSQYPFLLSLRHFSKG